MNERDEIKLYRMVKSLLDEEIRVDGEVAYVVRDINELVVGVMEFYEGRKSGNNN